MIMFKKMDKKKKTIFFALILLSLLIIFFPYIFLGRKFFNSYDTLNQHIPFYTEFRNKIYGGESIFWSHNFMFGGSFLTGKTFYLTTDIFSYIFLLFPFLEVVDVLFLLQLLKSFLSYIGMFRFLDEFNFSFKSKITCSIVYTFSSWIFLFYGMQSFISFVALIPFFFTGIEHYLKENKTIEVFIFTILLIGSNYYLFYSLSIFLIFYWIIRYCLYKSIKTDVKLFVKRTIFLIIIYLLAVGVSSPILIPVIYEMLHNTRVVYSGTSGFLWKPFSIYIDILLKFISSPIYVSKGYETILQSNYYRIDQIGLFISSCFCVLFPQVFIICPKQKKKICIISTLLILLFLLTQFGCSMFHGFSEPSFRWTIFVLFVFCIIFAYILDRIYLVNKRMLVISLSINIVIGLLLIFGFDMFNSSRIQLITLSISLILMIFYSFFIITNYKYIYYIIIFEIIVQGLTANCLWKDRFQNSYSYDFIPEKYFEKMNIHDEFYRVWISDYYVDMDYNCDFNFNNNLILGYKGLYIYDSAYQASLFPLMKSYNQMYHWYKLPYDGIMTATSTKYYVAKNIEDIPNQNIEYVEKIGNSEYNLYLNKDYKMFGYTNNNVCSFQNWNSIDLYVKDALLKDNLIINENDIVENKIEDLEKTDTHYLTNLSYTSDTIDGDIETTTDELLFLSIPYDRGWNIYCDENIMKKIQTDGGFMSILVPKGVHHIHMEYKPFGFSVGCIISFVSICIFVLIIVFNKKDIISIKK